jgi:hypothetical protein
MTAAALGIVTVLAVSVLVSRWTAAATPLASIGRRTLPIYVAHVIVVAGARVALQQLGIGRALVHLVVMVTLGVLVPITAAHFAARRPWAQWLFDLPGSVRRIVDRIAVGRASALESGGTSGPTGRVPQRLSGAAGHDRSAPHRVDCPDELPRQRRDNRVHDVNHRD